MQSITVKIINTSPYPLPSYATPGSSGVDLYANLADPVTVHPGEIVLIPTGIAVELPLGVEAQIRARSGLALRHGVIMANGVGTIDSDYRGEIGVIVTVVKNEAFTITPGMKIAQMVFCPYYNAHFTEQTTLDGSERNTGGFGSTGV